MPTTYLGDSVYAKYDGYFLTLYLDNGYGPHNVINLESEVMTALQSFYEQCRNPKGEIS